MTYYTNRLTWKEKETICTLFTGRAFKECFEKHEGQFHKIKKGFRAKSLEENEALSIAKDNMDKHFFISEWVNGKIDSWLKEMRENVKKLEQEGITHEDALAAMLLDSVFVDNVDLYFRLAGEKVDMNVCVKIEEKMKKIKSGGEKKLEAVERNKNTEEENQRLRDQIKSVEQRVDTLKEEYDQKIQEMESEKEGLALELDEAKKKVSALQSAHKMDDVDVLASYDDTDLSLLPAVDGNEIVSLCRVISGDTRVIRCADLTCHGQYNVFFKRKDLPAYFDNRDKIFRKDGPSDDGFCGIWNWSFTPNEKDPSTDYIQSQYNMAITPIEIIVVREASSLDELANMLNDGVDYQTHSRKIMFSICASNEHYIGILCKDKDLKSINGKTIFAEDYIEAPIYEFVDNDIIRFNEIGLAFYKKAFAGRPERLYLVKEPLDIVKDVVLSSISWTIYKTMGATRAQYKAFKGFLGGLPVDDITREIGTKCHCSDNEAKELLDEFLKIVWKYIDGDSLDDKIIFSAIAARPELEKRTKELIRLDWEKENNSLLENRDLLNAELEYKKEELKKTKSEKERIDANIAEKEKLAEDVETAVAERIQKARDNAADFIAEMAFAGGQRIQAAIAEVPIKSEISFKSLINPYHVFDTSGELNDLEAHHSWKDVIITAAMGFEGAGIVRKYREGLAAFLCTAYIEKQPIFIVGPNAMNVVQAFCAAVTGGKYGILCCEGSYSDQILASIGFNDEKIVIINNIITSGWMNRLPEILAKKDIFYIAIHPYAEDIQVEPKSLYGFILPLFTEFFVDAKATGNYLGGYFADDFQDYSLSKDAYENLKILSKFPVSALVKNRINSLVTILRDIHAAVTVDDVFIYLILPIAYATLTISKLKEAIEDEQKDAAITPALKRDLQYILGEV